MNKLSSKQRNLSAVNRQISLSWDKNVSLRAKDLSELTDYSYTKIIEPWVVQEVLRLSSKNDTILDIGCGCGYLANSIYQQQRQNITGIDFSRESIRYAKLKYPHIEFLEQDLYTFESDRKYNLCLAVMLLNNMPDIELFNHKIYQLLTESGRVIIVLPHPCFWPNKHIPVQDYCYLTENSYSLRFATKGQKNYPSDILYFHRSIEQYFNGFRSAGFTVERVMELPEADIMESPDIMAMVLRKH